jgi:hypothetical protein
MREGTSEISTSEGSLSDSETSSIRGFIVTEVRNGSTFAGHEMSQSSSTCGESRTLPEQEIEVGTKA